jgi:Rhodanese-like domain
MRRRSVPVEAVAVAATAILVAVVFNAVRPVGGLALIAQTPYQVLVPCPEPGGPVVPLPANDPDLAAGRTFLVDARPAEDFTRRHLPGAVHLPYDWLDPVPEDHLQDLVKAIAASGATRVVVYGDGGRPDSGEHLGREISGRGIKNVFFVSGGAPAVLGIEQP